MAIERPLTVPQALAMKKRTLAAALWFYAAWTFGSMIAWTLGLGIALGPIVGIAAAAIVLRAPQLTAGRSATA